jgi:lysozyme family protein
MAKFELAITHTLQAEGGLVNDKDDSGGFTYRGITRKNFPNWVGWSKLDKWIGTNSTPKTGKIFTEAEIPGLEKDCKDFYKQNFWIPVKGDEIINQEVANDIFDSSVNMGISQAVKLTQRTLGIPETGKMDITTLNTLNSQNSYV